MKFFQSDLSMLNSSIILVFLFDLLFFVFLVDGKFSEWRRGSCQTLEGDTCGVNMKGTKKLTRTCTNPKPQFGGKDCEGSNEKVEECELDPCPRNVLFEYEIRRHIPFRYNS